MNLITFVVQLYNEEKEKREQNLKYRFPRIHSIHCDTNIMTPTLKVLENCEWVEIY